MPPSSFLFQRISISFFTGLYLILSGCDDGNGETGATSKEKGMCPLGEAIETDGHRRLAMVVGVG